MYEKRSLSRVARAAAKPSHYVAAVNMALGMESPLRWLGRYLTGSGYYPATANIRTPQGKRAVRMWTRHDLLTVNEIFFRKDYAARGDERLIVDFGSNIGLSALYFLTAAPGAHLHLFEPIASNVERLQEQLKGLESRYTLSQVAVGTVDGPVSFGVEETGRYGGIGKPVGQMITVECRAAPDVLSAIIREHGAIDLLKIDIEGAEQAVVRSLSGETAADIVKIYAETRFKENPLHETHDWHQAGHIAVFTRRAS